MGFLVRLGCGFDGYGLYRLFFGGYCLCSRLPIGGFTMIMGDFTWWYEFVASFVIIYFMIGWYRTIYWKSTTSAVKLESKARIANLFSSRLSCI